MRTLLLFLYISLILGIPSSVQQAEATLFQGTFKYNSGTNFENFIVFISQITNHSEFASQFLTLWNQTITGDISSTDLNNFLTSGPQILGKAITSAIYDYISLKETYDVQPEMSSTEQDQLYDSVLQEIIQSLASFLFGGSDNVEVFLRDLFPTIYNLQECNTLNMTDAQKVIEDVLRHFNINASDYEDEIQEGLQVFYTHFLAPPNVTSVLPPQENETEYEGGYDRHEVKTPPSNTDTQQFIGDLLAIFNKKSNPEYAVAQDILLIWNESLYGQINTTDVRTLIGDTVNMLLSKFLAEHQIFQDAAQAIDDAITAPAFNTSSFFQLVKNTAEKIFTSYTSDQNDTNITYSASPVVTDVQMLIQASIMLLGNTTGPESLITYSLDALSDILNSGHLSIKDVTPLLEDAAEVIGNKTGYSNFTQGVIAIINDIASGQQINAANLAEDIEQVFANLVFGNSSNLSNAIQDVIYMVQGEFNNTIILDFFLNTAQVVAEATGYTGPVEDGINIVDELTTDQVNALTMVEDGADIISSVTGHGEIIQDAVQVFKDVTSGNPLDFLKDTLKVIADVTGVSEIAELVEDPEIIEEGAKLFGVFTSWVSSGVSMSSFPSILTLTLELTGAVTNKMQQLTLDYAQGLEDSSTDYRNLTAIVNEGANIAHDLESLNVTRPNQGSLKNIIGETINGLYSITGLGAVVMPEVVKAYNSFTSGNTTYKEIVENVIILLSDYLIFANTKTHLAAENYEAHNMVADVIQTFNDFTSGQITIDEFAEDIGALIADTLMTFEGEKLPIQAFDTPKLVKAIRDYSSNDVEDFVEDSMEVLAYAGLAGEDGAVLKHVVALNIAIDQYIAHSNGEMVINGEQNSFLY